MAATLDIAINPFGAEAGARRVNRALDGVRDRARGVVASIKKINTAALGIGGAIVFETVRRGLLNVLRTANDFEDAFTGVRKTVDLSEASFGVLRDRLETLSTEIPIVATELFAIAESAGQLNVQGVENLLKFTKTIAEIGASTNLTSEQAAVDFARFAKVVQVPIEQVDRLASTVVQLGNTFATNEQEIVAMMSRLAGAGRAAGLTAEAIVGVSAALVSVGIEAEAGGTAFSQLFIKFSKAAAIGGTAAEKFARQIGITVEAFQDLVKNSPELAQVAFIESLQRGEAAGQNQFKVLQDLGLTQARLTRAILSTAGAGDELSRAIDSASEAWDTNTAATIEAEKRFGTTTSTITKLQNALLLTSDSIGQTLQPVVTDLANRLLPVVIGIRDWIKENRNLVQGVLAMAAVFAAGGALLAGIALFIAILGPLGVGGAAVAGVVGGISLMAGAFVAFDEVRVASSRGINRLVEQLEDFREPLKETAGFWANLMLEMANLMIGGWATMLAITRRGMKAVTNLLSGDFLFREAFTDAFSGIVLEMKANLEKDFLQIGANFVKNMFKGVEKESAVARTQRQLIDDVKEFALPVVAPFVLPQRDLIAELKLTAEIAELRQEMTRDSKGSRREIEVGNLLLDQRRGIIESGDEATKELNKEMRVFVERIVDAEDATDKLMQRFNSPLKRFFEFSQDGFAVMEDAALQALNGIEDQLVRMVETAKFSFRSLANVIRSELLRAGIRQFITGPLAGGISTFLNAQQGDATGAGAAILAQETGITGTGNIGRRAMGGPIRKGQSVLVGERGVELFTPNSGGVVTPNHNLGGSGNIEVNVFNAPPGTQADVKVDTSQLEKTVIGIVLKSHRQGGAIRTMVRAGG